jgi:hypothetical protein
MTVKSPPEGLDDDVELKPQPGVPSEVVEEFLRDRDRYIASYSRAYGKILEEGGGFPIEDQGDCRRANDQGNQLSPPTPTSPSRRARRAR